MLENKSNIDSYKALIILVLGISLMLILPWILTQNSWLINFTQTGQIGDTIGGITAPISGLLGAYLVYLSFKAQIDTNNKQQKQIDEEKNYRKIQDKEKKLNRYIDNIKKDIEINGLPNSLLENINKDFKEIKLKEERILDRDENYKDILSNFYEKHESNIIRLNYVLKNIINYNNESDYKEKANIISYYMCIYININPFIRLASNMIPFNSFFQKPKEDYEQFYFPILSEFYTNIITIYKIYLYKELD